MHRSTRLQGCLAPWRHRDLSQSEAARCGPGGYPTHALARWTTEYGGANLAKWDTAHPLIAASLSIRAPCHEARARFPSPPHPRSDLHRHSLPICLGTDYRTRYTIGMLSGTAIVTFPPAAWSSPFPGCKPAHGHPYRVVAINQLKAGRAIPIGVCATLPITEALLG